MIKLFTVVTVVCSGLICSPAMAINLPIKALGINPAPVVAAAQPSAPPPASAVPPAARTVAVPTTSTVTPVKSYREWKNEKVQAAIKKVTITKAQIEYRKLNKQYLYTDPQISKTRDSELERYETMLKSDMYALDAAQELGVADYFAGYLTIQDNKSDAYKLAAGKMTPEEVNQLIKAYADSMFTTHSTGSTGTKVGPTAMEKPDLGK